ncbi:MAG: ribbon-helix-helix protein, CopG family [Actinobacteria bacterium]|nr:MAG: ribbon-helix-helix protein, CopG family [Actinomycetota bacterium]
MAKKKTTVYLDEDVLRSAKVLAARTGMSDSEVFESALRGYVGMEAAAAWGRTDLSDDEALALAVEEAHRYRAGL